MCLTVRMLKKEGIDSHKNSKVFKQKIKVIITKKNKPHKNGKSTGV